MTAALRRRHRAARARPPGPRAAGHRVRRADRGADRRRSSSAATPTRPAATSTSACARSELRRALAPRRRPDGPGRGRRGRRSQGGSARLRALEGREGGRGHVLALAVGRRAPRLAHRVLGDGRGAAGRRVRHPRRRHRPRLPAPRERGGADARRARQAAGPAVDAQRDAPARRREDVQVGRQHPRARRGARRGRRATRWSCTSSGGHYRQPIAFSRERLDAAAAASRRDPRGGPAAAATGTRRRTWRRCATRSSRRWPTTSTRRGRWRALFDWIREANRREGRSATRTCARCSACSGSRTCSTRTEAAPAGGRRAGRAPRTAARERARLGRGRPAARRAARARLGGPRRPGAAPRAARARSRDRLRPQRRCARRCGAGGACGGSGRRRGDRSGAPRRRRSSPGAKSTARCGSDAHQGVCAEVDDYPYADAAELLARARPVARRARRGHRPAEPRRRLPHGRVRGRDRRRDPRAPLGRGHRRGLQGVGGGGRAPADRPGAQPRRLPRARPRRPGAGSTARRPARARPTGARTTAAASCWCSARRAMGCGRGSRRCVRRPGRAAAARAHRIAQRERRRRRSCCTRSCSSGLTRPHKRASLAQSSR